MAATSAGPGRRLCLLTAHLHLDRPHTEPTVAAPRETQQQLPQRLQQDAGTVVLYRFDEGAGDACHEATDPALTLHAHKRALWSDVPGFGPVVRFERGQNDDANVLVGPVNHDALELRRCPCDFMLIFTVFGPFFDCFATILRLFCD